MEDDLSVLAFVEAYDNDADYLLGLVTESGTVSAGERERLEARVTELERQLHDAEVSIATLREVILQGNAAPSSSPYSSSRSGSRRALDKTP